MKTLVGAVLGISVFSVVALAFDTQYKTRFITSATLTINVREGRVITIKNFTQDTDASGQRGVIIAGVVPATPTPAPTVTPVPTPTPTLSTSATPSGAVLGDGQKLNDTATLFGDNNPTGTILFTLNDPSNATVYQDTVTVNNGNASYGTAASGNNPGGFSPSVAGTYTWFAVYSGDSNNGLASAAPETVIVSATPTPTPVSTPTPTPINAAVLTATILNPAATVNGLPTPPPTGESIKPFIIAGPATLTINPVPPATLAITYRKSSQPSGITPTPTPTPTSTTTTTSTSSATSTSSVGGSSTSSMSVVATASTATDDDDDDATYSSTPTPTPLPSASVTPTLSSTPTPTP